MGELVQYENRYYQWVKGDFTGRVETVKDYVDENGLNFVVFQSGKRINESLLLEYLIEVPEYQAKVAEESAAVETDFTHTHQPAPPPQRIQEKPAPPTMSPVLQLLQAQKTQDEEELEISVKVKVPKRDFIKILRASFGEEVDRDLYEYIGSQLDFQELADTIEEETKKFISKHYESNP